MYIAHKHACKLEQLKHLIKASDDLCISNVSNTLSIISFKIEPYG